MNSDVLPRGTGNFVSPPQLLYANRHRWFVISFLFLLTLVDSRLRGIIAAALSDAFLAVSVFVAGTLLLVFWIESRFSFNLGELMKNNLRWQPLIASALGVIPGCGGAIIVVTQFTRGQASFGAFIAVLVATMGDAAILLLARDPGAAAIVFSVSLVLGTLTGMVVDAIHGRDFMAIDQEAAKEVAQAFDSSPHEKYLTSTDVGWVRSVWGIVVGIGVVAGLLLALSFDPDEYISFGVIQPVYLLGLLGGVLCLLVWATTRKPDGHYLGQDSYPDEPMFQRVMKDTNFVTSWVVLAFVVYGIATEYFGLDVAALFSGEMIFMPLVAILIGFIPGCGPQIVVTTLYLAGAIPMSAQLANAIANDGDALFPALALAPKAATLATLYSAIPAVFAGYGWYFLVGS